MAGPANIPACNRCSCVVLALALLGGVATAPATPSRAEPIVDPSLGFSIDRPVGWDTWRDRDEPRMALQLVKGGQDTVPAKQRARIAVAHQSMPRHLAASELTQIADGMARGDPLYRRLLSQGKSAFGAPTVLARLYVGTFDDVPTRSMVAWIAAPGALFVLRGRVPEDKLADWDIMAHTLSTFRLPAATEPVKIPAMFPMPPRFAETAGPLRLSGLWRYGIAGQGVDGRAVVMQHGSRVWLTAVHRIPTASGSTREIVWRAEGEIGADIVLRYEFNSTAPADWRDGVLRLNVGEDGRLLTGSAANAFGSASAAFTFEAGATGPEIGDAPDVGEPLKLSGAWTERPSPSPGRHLVVLFQRGMTVSATGTQQEASGTVAWRAEGGVFGARLEMIYAQSPGPADILAEGRLSLELSADLDFLAGTILAGQSYRPVQFMRLGRLQPVSSASLPASLAGDWRIGRDEVCTFSPLGGARYVVSAPRFGGPRAVATVGAGEVAVVGADSGGREERYRLRLSPDAGRLVGVWHNSHVMTGVMTGAIALNRVGGEPRTSP